MLLTIPFIILVTFSLASSRVIDRCSQWYISSEGNNCTYCPPGTYKYLDCGNNGESAICKGCGHDHYQTYCNQALSCEPCRKTCPWRFSVPVHGEVCTMYTDMKCICEKGKYLFKETSEDGVCLNHSQCDKGFGLVEPGTPWSDTVCESCLEGKTFSDSALLQHCRPCKLCAAFRRNCSTTLDSECKDKPTPDNPDNKLNKTANNNDNCSTTQDAECEDKPTPDNTDNKLNKIANNIIIIQIVSSIVIGISLVFAIVYCCGKRLDEFRKELLEKCRGNANQPAEKAKDFSDDAKKPSHQPAGENQDIVDDDNKPGDQHAAEHQPLLDDANKPVDQPAAEDQSLLDDANKPVDQPAAEDQSLLDDANKPVEQPERDGDNCGVRQQTEAVLSTGESNEDRTKEKGSTNFMNERTRSISEPISLRFKGHRKYMY